MLELIPFNVANQSKCREIFTEYLHELTQAYRLGYSAIELSRLLQQEDANKIFATLRKEGMFPSIKPRRKNTHDLPEKFVEVLQQYRINFSQWCCSHGCDPSLTAQLISREEILGDATSAKVHRSFQVDFPETYTELFGKISTVSPIAHLTPKDTFPMTIVMDDEWTEREAKIHFALCIAIKLLRAACEVKP